MRIMLTNSSEFTLSPDIIVCPSLADVYVEIDKNRKDDKSLFIFIDTMFTEFDILTQLEMFNYEFDDFRIVLDKTQSLILDLNTKLRKDCYFTVNVTEIATNIFLNMEKYEGEYQIVDKIKDLERSLDNKSIIKNLVEYDFLSFRNSLYSIIKSVELLTENNAKLRKDLEVNSREKLDLTRELVSINKRIDECESNRKELLAENLKLKYMTYMNELNRDLTSTSTPLMYIKYLVPKQENYVIGFFNILNGLLRNKYNLNSTLIIIDDYRTISVKNIRENFTYISNSGEYNMANIGNKIITTSECSESLFNNFEKFAGIKDLFIVLDLTSTTASYVVGDGVYVVIENDYVREEIYNRLDNVKRINEKQIVETFLGNDEFNIELNVSQSTCFKDFEKLAMEIV